MIGMKVIGMGEQWRTVSALLYLTLVVPLVVVGADCPASSAAEVFGVG